MQFARKIKIYLKDYRILIDKQIEDNTIYFILDSNSRNSGLTDRLNTAVCINYIAQVNGFDFKMIFEHPFHLADYFGENEIKWVAYYEDLSYSIINSRIISYNGGGKIPKLKKKIRQYHVYIYDGRNILSSNNIPDHIYLWGEIFRRLFNPTTLLNSAIEKHIFKRNTYIAVHIRFVNALDDFEDGYYNNLRKKDAVILIDKCLNAITKIQQDNIGEEILVFSDSQIFLNIAKNEGLIVIPGKIGHSAFKGTDKDIVLKTIVDFRMISGARKIYRINSPELYKSAFAHFAAFSVGKQAILVKL